MARLLVFVGVVALLLVFIVVVLAMTNRRDARREDAKRLRAEANAAEKAITAIQTELVITGQAGVPLDSDVVQSHVDGYHARVRELYRKDPRP